MSNSVLFSLTANNVEPHAVAFVVENVDFFEPSNHYLPPNCNLDVPNKRYNCTGDGRPYNFMEWILTMKPGWPYIYL